MGHGREQDCMTSRGSFQPKAFYDSVSETLTVKVLLCCMMKYRKMFGTTFRRKVGFIDLKAGKHPLSWI